MSLVDSITVTSKGAIAFVAALTDRFLHSPLGRLVGQYGLYAAWAVALLASLGSLYFSEIDGFLPCLLCWYQRIAMYPLVVVGVVGILTKDTKVTLYALPLAIGGWLIALYHNLLYYGLLTETEATCRAGASCTTEYITWLGFLSIPLLSLLSFTFIIIALIVYRKVQVHEQRA